MAISFHVLTVAMLNALSPYVMSLVLDSSKRRGSDDQRSSRFTLAGGSIFLIYDGPLCYDHYVALLTFIHLFISFFEKTRPFFHLYNFQVDLGRVRTSLQELQEDLLRFMCVALPFQKPGFEDRYGSR